MLLGDILTAKRAVDPAGLARALAEQRLTEKRIGSLLIARGLADPDDVARALGDQHGVPAVLARHLAARDPALAALLPADYARRHVLLPIGRSRGGELIVCARDPRPELLAELEALVDGVVIVAVAPADAIEELVAASYGRRAVTDDGHGDFDVDLETGPVPRVDPEDDGYDAAMGVLTSGGYTLVGLDDARVTKDHTQSGQIEISGLRAAGAVLPAARKREPSLPPAQIAHPETKPQPMVAPRPAAPAAPRVASSLAELADIDVDDGWNSPELEPQAAPAIASSSGIAECLAALARVPSRDGATELAIGYVATRWTSALLFTIKEGAALGHRGHRVQPSAEAITAAALPLSAASSLKLAFDTRALATAPPPGAGAIQDRLDRLLGDPHALTVAPVPIGTRVVGLLAVGDCIISPSNAGADLAALGDALGLAYARILRESKPSR